MEPGAELSDQAYVEISMGLRHAIYGGMTGIAYDDNASLYPLVVRDKNGESVDLSAYSGRPLLIVNTASKCGFTKQYDDLEALYEMYAPQGLVVLGFPSNDFMGQEPGSDDEIESFCRLNHGVSFPIFPKAPVTGDAIQPLFKKLTQDGPLDLQGPVRWNFEKFLIDQEGRLIGRWRSWVKPSSRWIKRAIAQAVA